MQPATWYLCLGNDKINRSTCVHGHLVRMNRIAVTTGAECVVRRAVILDDAGVRVEQSEAGSTLVAVEDTIIAGAAADVVALVLGVGWVTEQNHRIDWNDVSKATFTQNLTINSLYWEYSVLIGAGLSTPPASVSLMMLAPWLKPTRTIRLDDPHMST